MFRAEVAQVIFFPSVDGDAPVRTSLGPGDDAEVMRGVDDDPTEPLWPDVVKKRRGILLARPIAGDGPTLAAAGLRDLMISPLYGEPGIVGAMVVANRLGQISTFEVEDLQLFETLANHASVSLENARLVNHLRESLSHLAEMNRMKDDFVATVSHELRTPLTAIQGYTKTLLRSDGPPDPLEPRSQRREALAPGGPDRDRRGGARR